MITLYIGKSGAGKDTFLKKQVALGVSPIISYTTRPMREGEVDGVDYYFVSLIKFLEMLDHKQIAEWRSYDTLVANQPAKWYYGSPWLDINKDYVGVVTPSGVLEYVKLYGAENINVIYVVTDDNIRRERAELRGSFDEIEWNRRVETDNKDFSPEIIQGLANVLEHDITVMYNNKDVDRVLFSKVSPKFDT